MKRIMERFIDAYVGRKLDFRVRLFNVLAIAGVAISFCMAALGLLNHAGAANVFTCVGAFTLSLFLLVYSKRSGNYKLCYTVTIVGIFLVMFPVLFFSSGGYLSGMPAFFVFAAAFTIFMLEGKRAVLFTVLEMAAYTACCVIAYHYPETVRWFETEQAVATDVVFSFVTVSAAVGASMLVHFGMYNRQQRELARRNEELDAINRQKTEFLSNISHELKTPLTVVSSHIQNLQRALAAQPALSPLADTANLIGGEAERMGLMVAQLLDVSRIDENQMPMRMVCEDIVELIHSMLEVYYPVFSKNHNRLTLRIAEDMPEVECDRMRVTQVLINLIGNAVRHTRNGEIIISAQAEDGGLLVMVEDNGEGIAAEQMPLLFERYKSHRASRDADSYAGRDTGTGLGLYICRYIVEAHGGRIWVESEPGAGTRARFTLPAARRA